MLNIGAVPMLSPELLTRYDTAGPRYTSYPTVPVWNASFTDDAYAAALRAAKDTRTPVALYAHFPYCAMKCLYCGCNALTTSRPETVDRYLDDLERELDLVVSHLGQYHSTVQMHWGGGTPNLLSEQQLSRAFTLFADRFHFTSNAELSIEADPRLVSPEQLYALRALGFTRISFGVQDLDANVQEAIGRMQSIELVRDVCTSARDAGFAGLNVDLIYGLPRQTLDTFAKTIEQIIELNPDRIACFGYAHLPAQRPHQRLIDEAELPDGALRAALFQMAVHEFTRAGYVWIGLDHFARASDPLARAQAAGRLHRNFMGYTTMPASHLVGVGMSAISDTAGSFAQNEPALGAWRERIHSGRLPTVRGHTLSDDDQQRQRAILHLMCNLELPYDAVPLSRDQVETRFARFEADGLLRFDHDRLSVTATGRFFIRNMAMELDAYLPSQQAAQRFSRTV